VNLALFTDLYQLTMLQAYFEEQMRDTAVFSLFVRRLPERRNYLLACGLDGVLAYLEALRFDDDAIRYLASLNLFREPFLDRLRQFRFAGDVYAVAEGTPVFANEPILEVVAPIGEGQFIETFVINQIQLQTMLASKAARVLEAAQGRRVIDFGLRRIHGIDAGMKAARAFHIAGVHGTSNVAAGQAYGLEVAGTMAHSYIQSHDDEAEAFRAFARLYPETVLLVDTYDTIAAVRRIVSLSREMGREFQVGAIRLDSGDLIELSRAARRILDEGGLQHVSIFASGSLNEDKVARLVAAGAPIDGFGVGTELGVSADAPSLEIIYKLVEYAGKGRIKLSPGKEVLPGRKQIFRVEQDGVATFDVLAGADESLAGRPLLECVMRGGVRLPAVQDSLSAARHRAEREIAKLPRSIRALQPASEDFPVRISDALSRARDQVLTRVQGLTNES
jgi:nicotinate phosphoribosyltransferase